MCEREREREREREEKRREEKRERACIELMFTIAFQLRSVHLIIAHHSQCIVLLTQQVAWVYK